MERRTPESPGQYRLRGSGVLAAVEPVGDANYCYLSVRYLLVYLIYTVSASSFFFYSLLCASPGCTDSSSLSLSLGLRRIERNKKTRISGITAPGL